MNKRSHYSVIFIRRRVCEKEQTGGNGPLQNPFEDSSFANYLPRRFLSGYLLYALNGQEIKECLQGRKNNLFSLYIHVCNKIF